MRRFGSPLFALVLTTATVCGCSAAEKSTAPVSGAERRFSPATSTLAAGALTVVADGVSGTTVTLTLRDSAGGVIVQRVAGVSMAATAGSLGPVIANSDGSYSAVFTAPTASGSATITAGVNGVELRTPIAIALVGGPIDLARTTFGVTVDVVYADGITTTLMIVSERDGYGNPTADGPSAVTFASTFGTIGNTDSLGTGVYRATLASTTMGTAIVSARIGGHTLNSTAQVRFVGGFWTDRLAMPEARQAMGGGVINNILYTVGGGGWDVSTYSNRTYAFSAATNAWSARAPMPTARGELAAGVVNGILYAVGGYANADLSTVEAYDPSTDTWSPRAPMPTAREGLAVGVVNGIMYAVGGNVRGARVSAAASRGGARLAAFTPPAAYNEIEAAHAVGTVEAYDPATDTWTTKASMPTPRTQLAVEVVNGILYAVGGGNGFGAGLGGLTTVEAYDPVTDMWRSVAPLPESYGRLGLGLGAVNGTLVAVGGFAVYEGTTAVDVFDPSTDRWTAAPPLPRGNQGMAVGVMNGILYVVGGACYDEVYAGVYAYTPP